MLDANLVGDILTCLLSNAVKYSEPDKPIRLEVAGDESQIIFELEDYGIGIPEEDRERVFEVFHRGRNVSHVSGTGLGLTIAKQSTELHGGTLTFVSTVGVGTTFRLTIPRDFPKE
jgi:signal transduction histidine kinase